MKCAKCGSSSSYCGEAWGSSVDLFLNTLNSLDHLWKEIGLNQEQVLERRNVFYEYLEEVLSQPVKEEKDAHKSLLELIENEKKEMDQICNELCIAQEKIPEDEKLPLLEMRMCISSKLNKLKEEKLSRQKEFAHLREQEQKLCAMLVEPCFQFSSEVNVPRPEDILKLQGYIQTLQSEKENRFKTMISLKKELVLMMEEIEFLPETSFGTNVIYSTDENITLSQKNLEEMTELIKKAKAQKVEMNEELVSLKEKLQNLWVRMGVSEEQREQFLAEHNGCKSSVLVTFRREIERLEEARKENMANYISQMRLELVNLWDKCYVSEDKRKKYAFFCDDNFSEELLDVHEEVVQNLKLFYKENESIFAKIQKRGQLWDRMIELEKKSNDPNRYNNRGGGLLQEEKERNRLLKDIPRLEAEILDAIQKYEEKSGKNFHIKEQRFDEYIDNQRNQFLAEREKEKQERKQRANLMDASTNRSTFIQGKRQLATPITTPNKYRRINDKTTMFKTPGSISIINKVRPKSAGPKTPKNQSKIMGRPVPKTTPRRKTAVRRGTLVTQNENESPMAGPGTGRGLLEANIASYTEFSKELNKETKANCRSSCKYPLRSLQTPSSITSVYSNSRMRGNLEMPLFI